MIKTSDPLEPIVEEIPAPSDKESPSSAQVLHGHLIPAQQQILLYSADDWEEFILEWVHHQKTKYKKVVRMSGASDMGVDVAGFTDDAGFDGVWDNYQCKHYDDALPSRPGELHPESLTDPDVILSHHPARATMRRLPPSIDDQVPPAAG